MTDPGPRPDWHHAILARAILDRVGRLRPGTTCCPSAIARDLAADWRPLMAPIRAEALRLQAEGRLRITQGGLPVPGPDLCGPIRLGGGPAP